MPQNSSAEKGIARIKSIAEDVYRTLGSGFSEDVYDRAMQVGLRLAKILYEGQKVIELKYKDHYYVGEGYPDLVIRCGDEKIIVELKAVSGDLGASEEQQLRNYMKILQVRYGILINFQHPGRKTGTNSLRNSRREERRSVSRKRLEAICLEKNQLYFLRSAFLQLQ
jgi:GxxExxY protein